MAQRGEWQQRIQAVLYHHGFLQRRDLMTGGGREWVAAQALPATARKQIVVAIAIIEALDRQLGARQAAIAASPALAFQR